MNIRELIFGVGAILRERVDGWSVTDGGQSRVYPDHPPLKLSSDSYPRGTVDTLAHVSTLSDLEGKVIEGSQLLDVTVYAVNSTELNQLVGDCATAISQYWDGTSDGTATDYSVGQPYLPNWFFIETRNVGPIISQEADDGFTRYSKTFEFAFNHVDTEGVEPAEIGGVEIGAVTDTDSFREVPTTETKYVSDTGEAPHITTHQPDDERLIISTALSEDIHSEGLPLKQQRDAIDALTDTDPPDNRFKFKDWDGWLGVTMVQFFRRRSGIQTCQIDAIYLDRDDYEGWDEFGEFGTLEASGTPNASETVV